MIHIVLYHQSYDYYAYQSTNIRNIVNKDNRIFNANPYKDRYNNNDDLIVHVRLGDIIDLINVRIFI